MKAMTASLCHLSGLTILLIKRLSLTILCFIFKFANRGPEVEEGELENEQQVRPSLTCSPRK